MQKALHVSQAIILTVEIHTCFSSNNCAHIHFIRSSIETTVPKREVQKEKLLKQRLFWSNEWTLVSRASQSLQCYPTELPLNRNVGSFISLRRKAARKSSKFFLLSTLRDEMHEQLHNDGFSSWLSYTVGEGK